jgi:hypothetical protein
MPDLFRNRVPVIAAVAVAIVVAVVLVLVLAGGDDDNPTVSRPSATRTTATSPAPQAAQPTGTTTAGKPSNRDAGGIQKTVTALVDANERGDAPELCRVVGQPVGGTGFDALHTCANRAGVDLGILPISDELSIDRITASRTRGTAYLAGGRVVSLRRHGAEWRVVGIRH